MKFSKFHNEIVEARSDAPKGDRKTTDENPLVVSYDDEGKKGKPGISGHMNLTTWMGIHAISKKFQKELAKAVIKAGKGKLVKISDKIKADYDKEYEEEGLPIRQLWIELSSRHDDKMNESELDSIFEAKEHPAYKDLYKLAKDLGGRDTRAIQDMAGKIANFTATGNRGIIADLGKAFKALDSYPRDAFISVMQKHDKALLKSIAFKAGFSINEEDLTEAKYSEKQIKMAYGIINDPRWKGGNMTAIVKKIEQIARGLSKHPDVAKVIKMTNEAVECPNCGSKDVKEEDGKYVCQNCGNTWNSEEE